MTKNNLTTMKKIFALLMLLCITLGANAQSGWRNPRTSSARITWLRSV